MMKGMGMICSLKNGLMSFALNPTYTPQIIDPFAMLQLFSGECAALACLRMLISSSDAHPYGLRCPTPACYHMCLASLSEALN
jgi:hypothetical protein